MRLIKPSAEIIEQKPGLDGLLQHIERCGRTCYKSEDKITEESAPKFVDMLVKRGHTAMVEHGTIYLTLGMGSRQEYFKYCTNKYSEATSEGEAEKCTWTGYVTTNYRVLLQNNWMGDLQYLTEPTKHIKRVTVKFICDRGVSHEFVRHRVFSFAQESTRYCNYSKNRFNNELTFIIPCWLDLDGGSYTYNYPDGFTKDGSKWGSELELNTFLLSLARSEATYLQLISQGWKPQQARAVLPNSLKTELIMTGTTEQWEGFFKLRDAQSAHPQARELAEPLHAKFRRLGYVD